MSSADSGVGSVDSTTSAAGEVDDEAAPLASTEVPEVAVKDSSCAGAGADAGVVASSPASAASAASAAVAPCAGSGAAADAAGSTTGGTSALRPRRRGLAVAVVDA